MQGQIETRPDAGIWQPVCCVLRAVLVLRTGTLGTTVRSGHWSQDSRFPGLLGHSPCENRGTSTETSFILLGLRK